jgi:hypothetical protein
MDLKSIGIYTSLAASAGRGFQAAAISGILLDLSNRIETSAIFGKLWQISHKRELIFCEGSDKEVADENRFLNNWIVAKGEVFAILAFRPVGVGPK